MKNLYIDAEWFPDQRVFLIGYAREDAKVQQLYSRSLTTGAVQKLFNQTTGHVYFYGPDIALLENHFQLDIRNHHHCVNLLRITRACMPNAKSWKLAHMEKVFGLKRNVAKYKQSIFQIYSDWNDRKYRERVLKYNQDDVYNLVRVKQKLFERYDIRRDYLHEIRMW
jgi:uncharacterized protein YprB with RNaseH-like and TPR domain